MEITRALATGRRLLREHGLDDWTIVADRAKTRAGVCRYSRREIGISGPLTTLHDESEVLDTILHEIAHALVGPRDSTRSCTRSPTPSSGPGTVMMPCGRPRLARSVPAGGSTSRPRPLACPRTGSGAARRVTRSLATEARPG
jgi:hypothetical protein